MTEVEAPIFFQGPSSALKPLVLQGGGALMLIGPDNQVVVPYQLEVKNLNFVVFPRGWRGRIFVLWTVLRWVLRGRG